MIHELAINNNGVSFIKRDGKLLLCPFAPSKPVQNYEKKIIEGQIQDVVVMDEALRQCGSWCPFFSVDPDIAVILKCGSNTIHLKLTKEAKQ